jgi:hypothetical protein
VTHREQRSRNSCEVAAQERLTNFWADQQDGSGGDFDDSWATRDVARRSHGGRGRLALEMKLAPRPRDGTARRCSAALLGKRPSACSRRRPPRTSPRRKPPPHGEGAIRDGRSSSGCCVTASLTNELADTLFYRECLMAIRCPACKADNTTA